MAAAQAAAAEQGKEAERRIDQLAADMAALQDKQAELQQQNSRKAQVGGAGSWRGEGWMRGGT